MYKKEITCQYSFSQHIRTIIIFFKYLCIQIFPFASVIPYFFCIRFVRLYVITLRSALCSWAKFEARFMKLFLLLLKKQYLTKKSFFFKISNNKTALNRIDQMKPFLNAFPFKMFENFFVYQHVVICWYFWKNTVILTAVSQRNGNCRYCGKATYRPSAAFGWFFVV